MYFIIRDSNPKGFDPSIVWNWRERCWAWDTDAMYDSQGGWAYADRHTAVRRRRALEKATRFSVLGTGKPAFRNFRVVDEKGLKEALTGNP